MIYYIHNNRVWCKSVPKHTNIEEIGTQAFKERVMNEVEWIVSKHGIKWTLNLSSEIKLTSDFIDFMQDLALKLCWALENDTSELDKIEKEIYYQIIDLLEGK